MKTLKNSIAALALVLLTAPAWAANPDSAVPLKTTSDLKEVIINNISGLDAAAMRLIDASVAINFMIDSEGKLVVTKVDSESELAMAYVKHMLKDISVNAVESIKNTNYKINVRYVKV